MNISLYLKVYLLTIPVFFAFDILWLGVIAKDFYRNNLGDLFRTNVNWTPAILFYLVYIVGILFFVVFPALEKGSWVRAVVWGGLFGFFTYATYELTNFAIVRGWPLKIVVVDLIWGVVLCSMVSLISFQIGKWLA